MQKLKRAERDRHKRFGKPFLDACIKPYLLMFQISLSQMSRFICRHIHL